MNLGVIRKGALQLMIDLGYEDGLGGKRPRATFSSDESRSLYMAGYESGQRAAQISATENINKRLGQ